MFVVSTGNEFCLMACLIADLQASMSNCRWNVLSSCFKRPNWIKKKFVTRFNWKRNVSLLGKSIKNLKIYLVGLLSIFITLFIQHLRNFQRIIRFLWNSRAFQYSEHHIYKVIFFRNALNETIFCQLENVLNFEMFSSFTFKNVLNAWTLSFSSNALNIATLGFGVLQNVSTVFGLGSSLVKHTLLLLFKLFKLKLFSVASLAVALKFWTKNSFFFSRNRIKIKSLL